MRTDEKILARIEEIEGRDFFGFEQGDLIMRLPFEKAKTFLDVRATKEEWKVLPRDGDSLRKVIFAYMPFAWSKANDKRGLSAARSISHFCAWTWLAGDDIITPAFNGTEDGYGRTKLVAICKHYGWGYLEWSEGVHYG